MSQQLTVYRGLELGGTPSGALRLRVCEGWTASAGLRGIMEKVIGRKPRAVAFVEARWVIGDNPSAIIEVDDLFDGPHDLPFGDDALDDWMAQVFGDELVLSSGQRVKFVRYDPVRFGPQAEWFLSQ